ncbi:MAG: hypothetical protein KF812_02730 [Fimbriimonadaceae bacterium]|nr:hypothetical protein [Fimbriimonadaceae bacterium]
MRFYSAIVCVFLACLTISFGAVPDPPRSGKSSLHFPNSNDYIEFEWKWSRWERNSREFFKDVECKNMCNGGKHLTHAQCDQSCDTPCRTLHKTDAEGFYTGGSWDEEQAIKGMLQTFGVPQAEGYARGLPFQLTEIALGGYDPSKVKVNIQVPCWNTKPCSTSKKAPEMAIYFCEMKLTMVRLTPIEGREPVRTIGPSVTYEPFMGVPTGDLITVSEFTSCRCQLFYKVSGLLPDNEDKTEVAMGTENGQTRPLTGEELSECEFAITHNDMNSANIVCTAAPDNLESILIPAGFELDCMSGGGQDTILADRAELQCPFDQNKSRIPPPPTKVRTLCIEMKKPEPTPRMRYRLMPPSSLGFLGLAEMARDSRFRGPWDQTRMWIATDYATYDQIREVLLPPPAQREYVRELKNCVQKGALNPSNEQVMKLMRREFLLEGVLDAESVTWLADYRLGVDADFIAFLKKDRGAYEHVISQRDGVAHIGALLASLCKASEFATAIWIARDAVPEQYRADLVASDGVARLAGRLTTTENAEEATAILDIIEGYPAPTPALFALNVRDSLPSDVRMRAKEYVATLAEGE